MNQFKFALVTLITLVSSQPLFAHPGHGTKETINPDGILHYLTEPIHLMPFAAIALFLFLFVIGKTYLRRSNDQRQTCMISRKEKQK